MGLDLSADGMAVLTTVPGKAKERVRVHAQLGDFPLLTDARVVRMSKRRGGYRWALRFEQMDERMRSNLEAFVRQQLASAARVRQAQLYAQRLKSGALPPIPTGPATVAEPVLPTPGPLPAVDPAEASPGATPLELDVDAPAGDVEPQRVLEIELPPMEPTQAPPLDRGAVAPPESQDAYDPYQASDAQGEAAMLDVGPIEPAASLAAPEPSPPTPAPEPASPEPASTPGPTEASVAHTFTPGVIEIDENEDLSLEDILSEVDGGDAPVSDLGLPPPQEKAADASGLGDVPVVDAQMGDEEETRRRDSSIPDQPAGEALRAQLDAPAAPAAEVPPKGNTLIADAAPSPLPDAEGDATVPLSGALPEVPSGKSTLIAGSQPYVPSTSSDIGGLPFGADGQDADDGEDSAEIALDSLQPSFGDTPAPQAPSPISASDDDAAALVPSLGDPAPMAEPPPSVDDGPSLDDALAQDDAPSLAGAPGFDAPPESPPDVTEAPVLRDDEGLDPADLAQVAPPFTATPIPGSVRSAVPSLDSALLRTTPTPPPGSRDASFHASPSPFYDGPEPAAESAEPEIPEPFGDVEPQSAVPTPVAEVDAEAAESAEQDDDEPPQPPAFLDEEPAAASGPIETPAPASPPLYADDAEPFDPYAPNPPSTVGAASPRIGSAPRALGELPPVVAGLYTPASNPSVKEDSGAYASASFEPFPSAEAGLYGDRSDVTFEEQQGNPRQRLAFLQHDDTKGVPEHHEHFLGDIEGVTSGLTPTSYKRSMTDEDLAPEVPAEESAVPPALGADASTSVEAAPELIEAEPTRPVDVGPAEFTPPPTDVESLGAPEGAALTPEPEELSMDDVEFEDSKVAAPGAQSRGLATYPEFNVIPDFDQAPQSDPRASEPPPAQTGKTMVASLESLGMLRPPDGSPMPAPTSSPADFAPVASFGGTQAPLAGFTVVAQLDDGGDDSAGTLSGSTMIATAEDVEAWKVAALASQEKKPAFDEERTVAFTPAPGSLEPMNPAAAPFGAPPMGEDDLTAMRVGRGGPSPSGGAGFELNPRGPAPAAAPPPSAPLARLPLAKMPVQARPGATVPAPSNRNGDTVPVPSRPVAQAEPLPSARPTLPPGNPRLPARGVARPGASSRSGTALESGGRPAPPPKPQARPQPQSAEQTLRKVPAVQGSGSMSPPASKKSLVEDALAQLKRKTEEKRKGRGGSDENPKGGAEAAAKPKRQANRTRRRKRLGAAELVDPAIAELYKAAMTDLDGSRD